MPLKADVFRDFPDLESISPIDKQRLIVWQNKLSDVLETISRRAQEVGQQVEQLQQQLSPLINNLGSPSITNNQDSLLASVGNLSADLKAVIVGATPVTGKVAIKDNTGNSVNVLIG